jgi:hypothetical protein
MGEYYVGHFEHPTGYVLRDTGRLVQGWPSWRRRREYEFTLDRAAPMTFCHRSGFAIQPDRHGLTDMGSVPEILQAIVSKDSYLPAFIIHDSACREHGLYFRAIGEPFTFCPVSSLDAHRLLREMVLALGGSLSMAGIIYAAVRVGGPNWKV